MSKPYSHPDDNHPPVEGGAPRLDADRRPTETAGPMRTNKTALDIWDALREPVGHQHRLATVAERSGVTVGTVRRHVREWAAAGYMRYADGVARLPNGARAYPPNISLDCGGQLIHVAYPDEPEYTSIDRTKDARRPTVERRRRDTPGPAGVVSLPGETPSEHYAHEQPDAPVEGTLEPPANLPVVHQGADLPALLDAGHRALVLATSNLERLRVRDHSRAVAEAARVLKRTEVLVDASVLVHTAERAIAEANPAPAAAEAGARKGTAPAPAPAPVEIDAGMLRQIRSAHAHVDEELFSLLVARSRESGEPLTRKLVARTGREARGAPANSKVVHYTGEYERGAPPHIVEAARRVMGGIDLDPASSEIFNRTVRAEKYYTAHEDGLKRAWSGRVWLNPPYKTSLVGAFVARLLDHIEASKVSQAILLTNNSTDTLWWQGAAAHALALCLPAGRLPFLGPSGVPLNGSPLQGQALLYFAREVDDGIERFASEFRRHGTVFYPVMWGAEE